MTNRILTESAKKSITPGIRIIPELNIAALNQGKDKELLLWYCLRSLDVTGCGRIPLLEAKKALTREYNYSKATFYRHLSLGEGKFWKTYENGRAVIEIWGVLTVCRCLCIHKVSRYIDVDIQHVVKYPRKALLWNTGAYRPFSTGRLNHPISRDSLAVKTKIQRRYQQRYDVKAETAKAQTTVKTRDKDSYKLFKQKLEVQHQGKKIYIDRSLGNIYVSHGVQSHRGMLRKVSSVVGDGKGSSLLTAEAPDRFLPSKRFYSTFKDWFKRYTKGKATDEDSYYPQMNKQHVYIQVAAW